MEGGAWLGSAPGGVRHIAGPRPEGEGGALRNSGAGASWLASGAEVGVATASQSWLNRGVGVCGILRR